MFKNENHLNRYIDILMRMKRNDAYHRSAAYLIALANLPPNDVFDFEEDRIKFSGLDKGWQTSSSMRATRLMFNLWNGCCSDEPGNRETSHFYTVEDIFYNAEFAPYFYEAVRIRYEWV